MQNRTHAELEADRRRGIALVVNPLEPFTHLRATLSASLIEREGEIDAALLGLVAREHVLLVGPPGTGKSALVTGITQAIADARSFAVLLTKFTTPEEVFGPVKLSALREDRYERALTGYMATAEVVFIDEIWKASSAILNTLLTILQERAYDNGGVRYACPLRLSIAASNEWPSAEEGQELGAVFDRYLIRRVVRPVSPANRARLLYDVLPRVERVIGLADLDAAADAASKLPVSDGAKESLARILDELAGAGVRPGDRRSRKAVGIARAAAWLAGSADVQTAHLECLADVLWSSPEQIEQTNEIVTRIANPIGSAIADLLRDVQEIGDAAAQKPDDTGVRAEAIKKLDSCKKQATKFAADNPGNRRASEMLQFVKQEYVKLVAAQMGIDPAKAAAFLGASS